MTTGFLRTVSPEGNEQFIITVPAGKKPERLDVFLTRTIENATRNKVQTGIDEGAVLVNQKRSKSSYQVAPGDVVTVTLPRPPAPEAEPEDIPINLVYEDEQLLVINKPAGMVVHPAFSNWTGTLVNALLHHVQNLSSWHEDPVRPGIVHRIDKDTSGLLVIAKNEVAHARLARDFARHQIEREYWALVVGTLKEPSGTIVKSIIRDPRNRKRFTTHPTDGKHAVTHFQVMRSFGPFSLMKLNLETGRTHQIRVHLSSIGVPIIGDSTYGGTVNHPHLQLVQEKDLFKKLLSVMPRQALHAKTLGFMHPASGEWIRFDSDLPDDFIQCIQLLEKFETNG
ncbi:MAG: RluA family pseudouridine synthase [Bacteroidetes bacterium]|nr:RluA family pseudouridine synthase [Bacteroidota bacterium]